MASTIDRDLVRHVAALSRLELSDGEVTRLAGELSVIIGYIDQLDELDTSDVPPATQAATSATVLRADEVEPSPGVEAALANAPQRRGSFFCVPRVLAGGSAES